MTDLKQLYQAVLEGNANLAKSVTEEALRQGVDPKKMLDEHMIPAMSEVGRLFEANEYFVPELLISARAMKTSLELLKPLLAETGVEPVARVAIGTVAGDLHNIGKNLVAAMLEGGGFEVIDLGVDVKPENFLAAIKEKGADLIAMSALLTTTMLSMKTVIESLEEAGLRNDVRVMIGGAPITQQYADRIGADGYGDNASAAVTVALKLVTG